MPEKQKRQLVRTSRRNVCRFDTCSLGPQLEVAGSNMQAPKLQVRSCRFQVAGSKLQVPSCRFENCSFQATGSKLQVQKLQVPSSRFQVAGFKVAASTFQVPRCNLEPATWKANSEQLHCRIHSKSRTTYILPRRDEKTVSWCPAGPDFFLCNLAPQGQKTLQVLHRGAENVLHF